MHWASNCLVVLLLCVARTPVFVVVCIWNALSGYSTNKLVGWTWWGTTGQLAHGHKGGEVDSRVHMTAWWLLLSRFDAFCVFCISQYCLGCIHMLHCGGFVVICHGHDSAVFKSCMYLFPSPPLKPFAYPNNFINVQFEISRVTCMFISSQHSHGIACILQTSFLALSSTCSSTTPSLVH